ncbi:alpha/beta fold hydrolase [Leucobacter denitrificans]|uniref:Alpha/beta fold hydrolase n=2 Tax=Leucobacter denitrificans TaxID=683042 RepID=A0A7G9S7R6_9MICO|nr:alpha/beta fold hydrolase [Leucobacter denitrificans]QNN63891.1 alpha/beta fold hydrolase [Leucobacter denitrificans]
MLAGKSDAEATHRVAFLHGLFGRGRNFATIAGALAPEVQSLLVDLPNHGKSAWTAEFDYAEMADLTAEHLRADFAASGPIDIVGHSMGGKVAMVLALRHPDLVRKLVVVDIAPVTSDPAQGNFAHLLDSLASVDLAQVGRRAEADEALKGPIPQAGVRGFLLQNLKHGDNGFEWEPNLDMLRAELRTIMAFPGISAPSFGGPVLWIRGDKSDYVRDEAIPIMKSLFPEVELVTVEGSGHWVHSEQPQAFTEALRTFLL